MIRNKKCGTPQVMRMFLKNTQKRFLKEAHFKSVLREKNFTNNMWHE
jgi:hypothetical protein